MIIPDISTISGNALTKKYFLHNYPEFTNYLLNRYPENFKFSERLYWYFNKLTSHPICLECGKPVSYRGFSLGYSDYCSAKCVSVSKHTKLKIKQTRLEKYGDENYNNREKSKQTCLGKYGVENPFGAYEVKTKIKQTNLKRYGVEYPLQSAEIQQIRKTNSLKKYGVDHPMRTTQIKQKSHLKYLKYNIDNNGDLIGYNDSGDRIMKCPHPQCDKCKEKTYIIPGTNYFSRKLYNIELCTKLLPIQQSHSRGTSLELFVTNILEEFGIEYVANNRTILNKSELDIYIPSKQIAIECNGVFWHSVQNNKHFKYHTNKYLKCREKGIQLITLWEDWIKTKPKIIKSILLNKLGVCNNIIYARKTTVGELDPHVSTQFLNTNHIQGRTNATVKLGLYFNDELLSVMTFSKKSKLSGSKSTNDDEYELSRFCNKLNTRVVGGASKLLKYFIKKYKPKTIYSFSSNDISNGNLYKELGFVSDNKITSAYWYIHKKELIRYHRTSFTKTRLKEMGYDIDGKTESQIMSELPYWKIYDSGHIKYIMNV